MRFARRVNLAIRTAQPSVLFAALLTSTLASPAAADTQPHGGMVRFPDVSATQIAFVYGGDIWLVPREGGVATPLASPPGEELFPRFSADGRTIAFVGNYDGNRDIYTLPVEGGVPTRVTHHPSQDTLCDWTPDGRLLFYSNGMGDMARQSQLFTVAAGGGLPERIPVPYGTTGAFSPDGVWLAYTPHTADFRTWKRYRGGLATDIWLFNLKDKSAKRITDWEGTDTLPMWNGVSLYYLSDNGPEHRLNVWMVDPQSGKREQVTKFTDFDVKWPAMGPGPAGKGEIVFQCGPRVFLLDLSAPGVSPKPVDIRVPGDRPKIKPRQVDASEFITAGSISPSGKRVAFAARGDIWSLPAEKGAVRNLTRSSGVAERDPSWSPDGRWIAYFSDATGDYELYITQSDGLGETRQLTRDGKAFRHQPIWSPDSKYIAFLEKDSALFLHSVDTGVTTPIDSDPWGSPIVPSWSSDSKWFAYGKNNVNHLSAVWLYNVESRQAKQVTAGVFNDSWPTFDRKGDYLFLASQRDVSEPIYEDIGQSFIYAQTDGLYVVPLRKDVKSPLLAKSDEEKWGDDGKDKDEKGSEAASKPADATSKPADSVTTAAGAAAKPADESGTDSDKKKDKKEPPKPVKIDLDAFESRLERLPVKRGAFTHLAVNAKGHLIYVRSTLSGVERESSIRIFDLEDEKREEKTVLDSAENFDLSADGEKLLVNTSGKYAVVSAAAGQKIEKTVPVGEMQVMVEPREEWREVFTDAWRMERDFFYDPNMHGVNWAAIRDQYGAMLADCVSRDDVGFIISEMISELNVGHAYYRPPPPDKNVPALNVGMLGCDYELHNGQYRIAKIYEGAPWDTDARNPLTRPGVDVKVGDYLLAANGVALDVKQDPWAAFQGMADRVVTLTIRDGAPSTQPATAASTQPARFPGSRDVVVKLLGSEADLRYRAWIEHNRARVAEKSGGRVGYLHVPDTGTNGQNNLFRQFYGQIDKAALIVDERWNGGGQIPTRFIELLNRPRTNYWARRDGFDQPWPPDSHQGPKCMLINGLAGSGGDLFPWYFRQSGLGKLIGTRTWGGLVGISGGPGLIDGAEVTIPDFAFYEKDGTWGVEGHGVDADIEVIQDPSKMQNGEDPQLDAAITLMLSEIERNPYRPPSRPAYPDRHGMGIRPEDK
ncbi:MAG: PDZ domain-containing protein [Phycisphaerae bacterium]